MFAVQSGIAKPDKFSRARLSNPEEFAVFGIPFDLVFVAGPNMFVVGLGFVEGICLLGEICGNLGEYK
jgi:hypothetical protein